MKKKKIILIIVLSVCVIGAFIFLCNINNGDTSNVSEAANLHNGDTSIVSEVTNLHNGDG
ncbi:MAG: hypothetical protein PHG16_12255 [Lachnospiraceae bacterium]|nr:hypothetical protein [Lachnospiraceae bacterium]